MKSIRLQNFQGYEDSTIEFSDTLTAITGETDAGKSSIVRAIKLVKDNVPSGDAFVRNGTDTMCITIDTVSRIKNPKLNGYQVEGLQKPFKALRGAVPEVVQDMLGMGPDSIQNQLRESIFLLDVSAGKVAQKLSELSDLEATTKALKYISSKKLKANSDIKALEKSISVTQGEIKKLSAFTAIDSALVEIEQKRTAIDRLAETYDTIYVLYENALQTQTELNSLPNTNALQPAQKLIVDYSSLNALKETRKKIHFNLSTCVYLEKKLKSNPDKLLKRAVRLQRMRKNAEMLRALIANYKQVNKELIQLEEQHSELLTKKIEAFGERCPLCGNRP